MTRVLLVDDHPVYLEGLAALLGAAGAATGIEVVGTATDGTGAVTAAAELAPDVVVMDVRMPGLDGIAATRRVVDAAAAAGRDVGVVVLTMSEEDETVFAAMRAGARGYLLKGATRVEITNAIATVAAGGAVFGPAIARRVADFLAPARTTAEGLFPELTGREREVLDLVAAGRANPQIAATLHLSPKTVRNVVSSIFTKLHVADRAEAIVRAREAGLGRASGATDGLRR
ncbi:response regulator [Actinomycetospora termitidis]|uniref:Response regulator transcription factor n=1 Tax=Actinomycetospora termitidis TaxID=3053470 RepID=A0ABT7MDA5_9PSEU|nr:response regulator transcription factor [Actinomycetospora sp. Odt1-22]MDL5158645.1 response regulator transcription factor [Actinomycetospora sp. Odt1-22]